jgi:nicotinate-nucleotide adenylyltransferase
MAWLRPPGPVATGLTIGLFGGSFNPAHEGHRYVAETALKRLALDYVWLLVSPQNPLKATNGMMPLARRLQGARSMARGNRRLIVSGLEDTIKSRYTNDTVRLLRTRFPQVRFVWLMGSDNLEQFHRWQHWRDILNAVPAAVVLRPGFVLAPLKAKAIQAMGHRIRIVDGRRNESSATAIRARGGEATAQVIHSGDVPTHI